LSQSVHTKLRLSYLGNVRLDRHGAVALLRELNDLNIVHPSFVAVEKRKHGGFVIVIKGDCDIRALKEFVAEKNLAIETDKVKDTITIFEP